MVVSNVSCTVGRDCYLNPIASAEVHNPSTDAWMGSFGETFNAMPRVAWAFRRPSVVACPGRFAGQATISPALVLADSPDG